MEIRDITIEIEAPARLTIADLKKHTGPILGWVKVFDEDGEYVRLVKSDLLKRLGADVSHANDGIHENTPLTEGCRIEHGVFYIN